MPVRTFHNAIAETVSGQSGAIATFNAEAVGLYIDVSAVSGGTPTLDLKIQDSTDGINWYDVPNLASTQISTVSTQVVRPTIGQKLGRKMRLVWTLGGSTPSFTFTAEFVTLSYHGDE